MINFSIDIKPMGAVRMTQRSKWTEKAQQYLAYKGMIGMIARKHFQEPVAGPLSVSVRFYYPVPASWSNKRRERALSGKELPIVKPDLDNCVKGIYDALNKIAWKDDNQVVSTTARKFYAEQPRIEIQIWEEEAA